MNLDAWLPVLVVLTSLVTGLAIFLLGEEQQLARTVLNLAGAIVKLLFVGIMLWGVFHNHIYETRTTVLPGLDLVFAADALAMLFVTLSAVLWLLTTIYAIGYLEGSPNRSRFFGFFSLCVTSTMGIAFAGNLLTFFVFYEMLTLTTYPLVVHRGTDASMAAGRTYLIYTLAGGAILLVAVVWLSALAGPVEFTQGGGLTHIKDQHRSALIAIFALLVGGLGVKAALVPLHGWLPVAMVAPAPVSALLHAVAVVKAGAFGIIRVVYDLFGSDLCAELHLTQPLAVLAAVTILYASVRALYQDDLKRRLAYSTVSQVSYITLGVALGGPLASIGALVHLVHQGVMKITLFFCAGNLAETLGLRRVSELNGAARRMPLTMAAFSLGAFGMIGIPPLAGFVTKWYLGLGSLEVDEGWVLPVLAASTLLNAAYFLPILHAAYFKASPGTGAKEASRRRFETALSLLIPTLVTGVLSLVAGLFAGTAVSPLEWARLIAEREFRP